MGNQASFGGVNGFKINRCVGLVFIYLAALQILSLSQNSLQSSIVDELLAVLLLPFAIIVGTRKSLLGVWLGFFIYSLLGLLSAYINSVGGVPQPQAALYDIALDAKLPILFLGFLWLLLHTTDLYYVLNRVCWVFVLLALLNLPFVFWQSLVSGGYGLHGQSLISRMGFYQPQGLYWHHVDSVWRTFVGALSMAYLYKENRSLFKLFGLVMLIIGVLLHFSAKEIIALLLALFFLFNGRRISLKSVITGVVIMLAIGVPLLIYTPLGEVVDSQLSAYLGQDTYDGQARSMLTLISLSITRDFFPLGSGAGTYASPPSYQMGYSNLYNMYGLSNIWGISEDNPSYIVDVLWPKISAQTGVFGAFAYLFFFWRMNRASVYLFFKDMSNQAWLCGAIFFSIFLFSFASSPYTQEFMVIVAAFFSAFAHSMWKRRQ